MLDLILQSINSFGYHHQLPSMRPYLYLPVKTPGGGKKPPHTHKKMRSCINKKQHYVTINTIF